MTTSSKTQTSQTDPQVLPQISPKDKKTDIYAAYESLLSKFQENNESGDIKSSMTRKEEDQKIQKVSGLSPETVLSSIATAEGEVKKGLSCLAEAITKEFQKLIELKEVLGFEKKRLGEIHDIQIEADTLSNLIAAHKEENVAKAREEAGQRVRHLEEVKARIMEGQTNAERELLKQTIVALKKKIEEQEEDIARLKKELEIANRGVKDIALKVIEGNFRSHQSLSDSSPKGTSKDKEALSSL